MMKTIYISLCKFLFVLSSVVGCALVHAADIEIFPDDSFETAVENLNPGDTLTVHAGTYVDSGRISIAVKGTQNSPVTIQAAAGEQRPLITRDAGDAAQNTINIEGAEFLTISGLEISSNGGDGINMSGNPSYITIEDLIIHDISVGINFRSSMHHITVRRNQIFSTNDTGEGMYVGCNNATCAVSESLIENNWIYNTLAATQGDGIEIKKGSHSNIIRDNVIYDTNYPCILLYGTEGNPRNIVEGNVMWNCGDSGIQVAADSVIRNNIILDGPGNGINSQPHQGATPTNLELTHNTIIGGNPCIRLSDWDNKQGLIFANNAVYCPSGSFAVGGLTGVAVSGNIFEPATGSFPSAGYATGRSESQDFINAAGRNVYPTSDSPLIGAGDPTYATSSDFNGTTRLSSVDAGAYAWTTTTNPGWQVAPGFKDADPAPTLMLDASPTTIEFQGQSSLSWSTTNAVTCEASGDWSGSKPTSGQETVGPLGETSDFGLSCTNADSISVTRNVTITVAQTPTNPPPTLELSASATSVPLNNAAMLAWNSTETSSCLASNAWSGTKSVTGNESTGALSGDATFTLECTGLGGSISRSVTVQVQPETSSANNPTTGTGAITWLNMMLIVAIGLRLPRKTPKISTARGNID